MNVYPLSSHAPAPADIETLQLSHFSGTDLIGAGAGVLLLSSSAPDLRGSDYTGDTGNTYLHYHHKAAVTIAKRFMDSWSQNRYIKLSPL